MKTFYVADRKDLSNKELGNEFFYLAMKTFEDKYPNEEFFNDSVSVGNIYRNKNTISCQIKFTKNNTICQCNYYIKNKTHTIRFYRLDEECSFYAGKIQGESKISFVIRTPEEMEHAKV